MRSNEVNKNTLRRITSAGLLGLALLHEAGQFLPAVAAPPPVGTVSTPGETSFESPVHSSTEPGDDRLFELPYVSKLNESDAEREQRQLRESLDAIRQRANWEIAFPHQAAIRLKLEANQAKSGDVFPLPAVFPAAAATFKHGVFLPEMVVPPAIPLGWSSEYIAGASSEADTAVVKKINTILYTQHLLRANLRVITANDGIYIAYPPATIATQYAEYEPTADLLKEPVLKRLVTAPDGKSVAQMRTDIAQAAAQGTAFDTSLATVYTSMAPHFSMPSKFAEITLPSGIVVYLVAGIVGAVAGDTFEAVLASSSEVPYMSEFRSDQVGPNGASRELVTWRFGDSSLNGGSDQRLLFIPRINPFDSLAAYGVSKSALKFAIWNPETRDFGMGFLVSKDTRPEGLDAMFFPAANQSEQTIRREVSAGYLRDPGYNLIGRLGFSQDAQRDTYLTRLDEGRDALMHVGVSANYPGAIPVTDIAGNPQYYLAYQTDQQQAVPYALTAELLAAFGGRFADQDPSKNIIARTSHRGTFVSALNSETAQLPAKIVTATSATADQLNRAGAVLSTQGSTGAYVLAVPASASDSSYTMGEAIAVLQSLWAAPLRYQGRTVGTNDQMTSLNNEKFRAELLQALEDSIVGRRKQPDPNNESTPPMAPPPAENWPGKEVCTNRAERTDLFPDFLNQINVPPAFATKARELARRSFFDHNHRYGWYADPPENRSDASLMYLSVPIGHYPDSFAINGKVVQRLRLLAVCVPYRFPVIDDRGRVLTDISTWDWEPIGAPQDFGISFRDEYNPSEQEKLQFPYSYTGEMR